MATKKQIAANRRNALKSTGPRTEKGKAAVRLNALRHGLRTQPGMLPAESLNELNQIRGEFLRLFQPQSRADVRLVHRRPAPTGKSSTCSALKASSSANPSR